jgi:hypothetical protein
MQQQQQQQMGVSCGMTARLWHLGAAASTVDGFASGPDEEKRLVEAYQS